MVEKCCSVCMCSTCGTISGVLVLVAGAVMLLSSLAMLDGTMAMMVAGAALALYGLGGIVHAMNMCPLCKAK